MQSLTTFRRLASMGLMLVSLAACGKSEPVYTSISAVGRNYLPYNLSGFTVSDQFGNKVSVGSDLTPGGGGGAVSCCYALKGTQFDVSWSYYDADQWHAGDEKKFRATAKATLPETPQPEKIGDRILEVHFYPDHHVELQFPAGISDPPQLPMVDVVRALLAKHRDALDKRYDDTLGESTRRISRVVAQAWLKYRFSDERDLEQYAYYALLVNPQFDAHPAVQKIIQADKAKPGAFAAALDALPSSVSKQLKGGHFATVPVPSVPDGLLPPPREAYEHAG